MELARKDLAQTLQPFCPSSILREGRHRTIINRPFDPERSAPSSSSQIDGLASDGARQSPRGER